MWAGGLLPNTADLSQIRTSSAEIRHVWSRPGKCWPKSGKMWPTLVECGQNWTKSVAELQRAPRSSRAVAMRERFAHERPLPQATGVPTTTPSASSCGGAGQPAMCSARSSAWRSSAASSSSSCSRYIRASRRPRRVKMTQNMLRGVFPEHLFFECFWGVCPEASMVESNAEYCSSLPPPTPRPSPGVLSTGIRVLSSNSTLPRLSRRRPSARLHLRSSKHVCPLSAHAFCPERPTCRAEAIVVEGNDNFDAACHICCKRQLW